MEQEVIDRHLVNCTKAVDAGMDVVAKAMSVLPHQRLEAEEKTEDKTLVTQTDILSAKEMSLWVPPDDSILIEGGVNRDTPSDALYIGDPLDGTGAFAIGLPTPTVVMAVYSKSRKQLICSAAGIPATGEIFIATINSKTETEFGEPVTTWNGKLGRDGKAIVFLDVSHGFKNKTAGGMVFTDDQIRTLISRITIKANLLIPGSNILIQLKVAIGGTGAAGSILTAKGGPQDLCAVLQVLQAGGAARGFYAGNGVLMETDPLNVMTTNILVCGNNQDTTDELSEMVSSVF